MLSASTAMPAGTCSPCSSRSIPPTSRPNSAWHSRVALASSAPISANARSLLFSVGPASSAHFASTSFSTAATKGVGSSGRSPAKMGPPSRVTASRLPRLASSSASVPSMFDCAVVKSFVILWIGSMDESSHESRFSNPVRIRTISSVWLFTAARAAFRSAARVLIASELSTREAGRKPAARRSGCHTVAAAPSLSPCSFSYSCTKNTVNESQFLSSSKSDE